MGTLQFFSVRVSAMKASIKFRENQNPFLRARIPLNLLGLPFQSGIEAGVKSELSMNFSTSFESGPLFKFSYRPNDSCNPFSFSVKTGIGPFGSSINSPVTMNVEFNLLANGSPAFFLNFKPRIGDFSIKKSVKHGDNDDGELPPVTTLFTGMELSARTVWPVRDRALLSLRWNVRFPAEWRNLFTADDTRSDLMAGVSFAEMPCLVLSKIGFKQVAMVKQGSEKTLELPPEIVAGKSSSGKYSQNPGKETAPAGNNVNRISKFR